MEMFLPVVYVGFLMWVAAFIISVPKSADKIADGFVDTSRFAKPKEISTSVKNAA